MSKDWYWLCQQQNQNTHSISEEFWFKVWNNRNCYK